LQSKHAEELAALQQKLSAEFESKIRDLESQHQSAISESKRSGDSNSGKIAQLQTQLSDRDKQFETAFSAMRNKYTERLNAADSTIAKLRLEFQQLQTEKTTQLTALNEKLDSSAAALLSVTSELEAEKQQQKSTIISTDNSALDASLEELRSILKEKDSLLASNQDMLQSVCIVNSLSCDCSQLSLVILFVAVICQ
jgi:hypothetical protein